MIDAHMTGIVPTADEVVEMTEKMKAFLLPNVAKTEAEKAAFDSAVILQIVHEKTIASQIGISALPSGVSGFTVGHFSMQFANGFKQSASMTKADLCPAAYAKLLNAGLLYRGAMSSCDGLGEDDVLR